MLRLFAVGVLLFHLVAVSAQVPATTVAATAPVSVSAVPGEAAQRAASAQPIDPTAATEVFMNRLQGEARARSDSYAEGGYWLLLWNFLYGLVVAWLLIRSRISVRMRSFAERRTRRRNLQTTIYVLMYVPLVALLTLPLALYQDFYREHQYGLSNLSLGHWLMEGVIGLGVNMALLALALTGFYALLRRFPRAWLTWATIAGAGFLMLLFMAAPVFIAPLFNTYQPLPDGALRSEILSLARANGIPADKVYYFDASKQTKRISANVSGLFGTTRIALNDNLLNRTSPAEIKAVMAHEMGHYVANHAMWFTLSFTIIFMGGLLFIRGSWNWAASRFGNRAGVRDISDPAGLPLLAALLSVYLFLITPLTNTISRSAETEADIFGLNAAREPDGFAEVTLRLAEYRKLRPGPVEEFIFFDHPSGYNRIYGAMRWKAENRQ